MEENRSGYRILVADDDPQCPSISERLIRRVCYQMLSSLPGASRARARSLPSRSNGRTAHPKRKDARKNREAVDKHLLFWYNSLRWFGSGEMAEWFKALVLKTSDAERHRGFESLSLRQLHPWRSTQEAEGAPLLRE